MGESSCRPWKTMLLVAHILFSDGDAEAPKAKKSQKKYEHDTSMAAFPKIGQ